MTMGTHPADHWKPGEGGRMGGLRARVGGSIGGGIGWLIFILLFAAFWAGPPFTLFQDIVIVLVSFLILVGFLGVMWASFGMKFMR